MRTSLVVQQLRLCTAKAEVTGSIPGWGTKILHATWCGKQLKKKKKLKEYYALKNYMFYH